MVFERLTKLFNAGGASRPPKQLEAALLVLSLKSPELMKSTLNYVTTGLPAEALLEFQSSVDNEVRNLLGDPGAGRWPYYRNDLDARVKKALDGRDGLPDCYDAMFILLGDHDALTAEQSVRLGRVLAAAQEAPNLTAADAVPDWLNALWGTSQRDSPKARPRRPTAWDVSRIRALMEADGRDGTEIATATAQLIIRSAPVVSWQSLRHPAIGGTLEFAREHRDLMIQTFKDATADDKLAFLAKVEADPSLDAALEGLLLLAMRDTSKGVRTAAGGAVSKLDPQTRATLLTRVIESTPAGQIESALDLLVRFGDAPARAALESLPANEKNAKKRLLIEAALVRLSDVSAGPETDLDLPPWEPVPDAELGADFVEEALAHIAGVIQKADEQLAEVPEAEQRGWHARNLRDRLALASRLDRRWFEELRAYLNGAQQAPTNLNAVLPSALVPTDSLPLPRLVRLYGLTWRLHPHAVGLDLRAMLDAIERADLEDATTRTDVIAVTPEEFIAMLVFTWSNAHDPEDVWPFFVEHPQKLDQALGLDSDARTYSSSYDLTTAIEILKAFPSLPQRYVARLTELALGTGKSHRLLAQEALANRSNVGEIASRGLTDSRAEVRIAAADWLARLGSEEAVAPLRAALAKEKRETAMAAMLGSLSRLGQDLADDLRKDKLAAEAAKGIKAKAPAALAWFPVESLPRVRWADGSPVERAIVVWWLRLAAKLKDPLGSGLLPIYIGLLDEDSQQELGEFVLHAWIAHDTVGPSDEEARAYAAGRVDQEYDRYQHWARRDRRNEWIQAQAAKPKEQIFEELRRDKAAEYVGSAIDTKGILALSVGARGHVVHSATTGYIRNHGGRRAQVEALVTAASGNDDPAAIQLVLQVARRFRQRSVQEKAGELIEAIAERRGWSAEELADRTIPTAGFDDDGLLHLDYGPREFLGRIGRSPKGAWQIDLSAPDGKQVKSLPAAAKADDEELVKETKKQLTASKKELRQLVDVQSGRLFEAMCLQRSWTAAQWKELIAGHPVLSQLITGLVWQAGASEAPAGADALFRLTPEGELIGIDDDTFDLPDEAEVRLAHAATVTPEAAQAWRSHLEDYEAAPLFGQFDTPVGQYPGEAVKIDSRLGWLSDSFAIRGRATKRGYTRSQAEDGGWFSEYRREYPSAGLAAVISFTGSYLPEEQIPAAVTTLTFEPLRSGKLRPLGEVPPILLAESVADYEYIGDAGIFDGDWQSKAAF